MHFVHQSQKPVKVRITAEHFGGRTTTHYVIVGRAAGESCLTVQNRAADEYRRKHGLAAHRGVRHQLRRLTYSPTAPGLTRRGRSSS
jgi:hypothetical protein